MEINKVIKRSTLFLLFLKPFLAYEMKQNFEGTSLFLAEFLTKIMTKTIRIINKKVMFRKPKI